MARQVTRFKSTRSNATNVASKATNNMTRQTKRAARRPDGEKKLEIVEKLLFGKTIMFQLTCVQVNVLFALPRQIVDQGQETRDNGDCVAGEANSGGNEE